MHLKVLASFAFAAIAAAHVCIGTKSNIEIPDYVTDKANPLFLNTDTGEKFYKYSTSTGNATEEEMNTIEFITALDYDDEGYLWLISEDGKPVAKMTKVYVDEFAGDIPTDVIGDEHYEFDVAAFDNLLHEVRADPDLRQRAQAWVIDNKQQLLDTPANAKRKLHEDQQLTRCGPSRCQSRRTCMEWAQWCNHCFRFRCNYFTTPIVDAC